MIQGQVFIPGVSEDGHVLASSLNLSRESRDFEWVLLKLLRVWRSHVVSCNSEIASLTFVKSSDRKMIPGEVEKVYNAMILKNELVF